jgi:hypothetical protein
MLAPVAQLRAPSGGRLPLDCVYVYVCNIPDAATEEEAFQSAFATKGSCRKRMTSHNPGLWCEETAYKGRREHRQVNSQSTHRPGSPNRRKSCIEVRRRLLLSPAALPSLWNAFWIRGPRGSLL